MVESGPGLCTGGINFLSSGIETGVIPKCRVPCPSRILSSEAPTGASQAVLTCDLPLSFLGDSPVLPGPTRD